MPRGFAQFCLDSREQAREWRGLVCVRCGEQLTVTAPRRLLFLDAMKCYGCQRVSSFRGPKMLSIDIQMNC